MPDTAQTVGSQTLSPASATNRVSTGVIDRSGHWLVPGLIAAWIVWAATSPAGVGALGWLVGAILLLMGVAAVSAALEARTARQQKAYFGEPRVSLPGAPLYPGARFTVRLAVPTHSRVTVKLAELRLVCWSLIVSHYGAQSRRGTTWQPRTASSVDMTAGVSFSDSELHAECQLVLPTDAGPATDKRHWRLDLALEVAECSSTLYAEFPLDILAAPPATSPMPPDSDTPLAAPPPGTTRARLAERISRHDDRCSRDMLACLDALEKLSGEADLVRSLRATLERAAACVTFSASHDDVPPLEVRFGPTPSTPEGPMFPELEPTRPEAIAFVESLERLQKGLISEANIQDFYDARHTALAYLRAAALVARCAARFGERSGSGPERHADAPTI